MELSAIITSVVSLLAALGGLEFLKWLWTRKSKARMASAEADAAELRASADEYHLLKERIDNLNEQLAAKEKRFDQQTQLLRQTNKELLEEIKQNGLLSAKIAALEAERAMKLCQVRNCAKREPQSGY
jgi:uncharacterized protein YydD (DUF2326 family)